MGGDKFTQVHNGVFRDSRLSAKAMGIFGHISTHSAGWKTSIASIAKNVKDGEHTVKMALRELEEHHYVVRGQERDANGRHGGGWLFVTDLPAQLADLGITDVEEIGTKVREYVELWLDKRRSETASGESSYGEDLHPRRPGTAR